MSAKTVIPEVLWAQRSSATEETKNWVYLTFSVPDVAPDTLKVELKPHGVAFTGPSATLRQTYAVDLALYAEIVPDKSTVSHTGKCVEMKLQKKDVKEEYWPRLLKDAQKVHFVKTDFDKWVDQDEQNEQADDDVPFGGMGGMPGMGGMGGMGMGGMGGMPGMSGMGGGLDGLDFSSLGGGQDLDDDDDDMPELADEDADDEGAADHHHDEPEEVHGKTPVEDTGKAPAVDTGKAPEKSD